MTRLQSHVLNFTVQLPNTEHSPVSLEHPPALQTYGAQQFIFINHLTHVFMDYTSRLEPIKTSTDNAEVI